MTTSSSSGGWSMWNIQQIITLRIILIYNLFRLLHRFDQFPLWILYRRVHMYLRYNINNSSDYVAHQTLLVLDASLCRQFRLSLVEIVIPHMCSVPNDLLMDNPISKHPFYQWVDLIDMTGLIWPQVWECNCLGILLGNWSIAYQTLRMYPIDAKITRPRHQQMPYYFYANKILILCRNVDEYYSEILNLLRSVCL